MPKDDREAARLLGAAALADNIDAQVEYGIALFNGIGVAEERSRGGEIFQARGAARQPGGAEPVGAHLRHGQGRPCRPIRSRP